MAVTPEKQAAIEAAMMAHARHPVVLELNVQQLLMVIGGLQLALRHPDFPPTSHRHLSLMIEQWRSDLYTLDVQLAHLVDYGFMLEHDRERTDP
jgi:hypothetical protein